VLALLLGQRFYIHYSRLMQDSGEPVSAEAAKTNADRKLSTGDTALSNLVVFGAGFIISVAGIGLMLAHDLSHVVASRAMKMVFDEDVQVHTDPEYEQAEAEWADGNHMEAIRLMREYLKKKPREIHALIRIAEIYENDLKNPLAAALEYEEVLKHKLRPERWGWAAIHLCNIYTSKLQKRDQAVALLRRIESECGDTPPAEKARKRLAMLDGDPAEIPTQPSADDDPSATGRS
jgi:hypothetical protein